MPEFGYPVSVKRCLSYNSIHFCSLEIVSLYYLAYLEGISSNCGRGLVESVKAEVNISSHGEDSLSEIF